MDFDGEQQDGGVGSLDMLTDDQPSPHPSGSSKGGGGGKGKESKDKEKEKEKPRTGKACLNCRRQKVRPLDILFLCLVAKREADELEREGQMKCEENNHPQGCTRCRGSGIECIFKPRANAAVMINEAVW